MNLSSIASNDFVQKSISAPFSRKDVPQEPEGDIVAKEVEWIANKIIEFSQLYAGEGVRLLERRMRAMNLEDGSRCRALLEQLVDATPVRKEEKPSRRHNEITDRALIAMSERISLERLDLTGCRQVTDAGICAIATACQEGLLALYLGGTQASDASLAVIAEECWNLMGLDISGCQNITDNGIQELMKRCGETLTRLDLGDTTISDAALCTIAKEGKNLHGLNLSYCNQITDAGLSDIVKGCGQLKTLYIGRCAKVVGNGLAAVPKGSPLEELRIIEFPRMPAKSLKTIAKRCTSLVTLHLYDVPHVDAALGIIAKRATRLVRLVLARCTTIFDGHLAIIGRFRPDMKDLSLRGCSKITNSGVRLIAKGCKQLEQIDLSGTAITGHGINALVKGCTALTGIDVEGCQITDDDLKTMLSLCTGLQELRIGRTAISDLGLNLIHALGTRLEKISLAGCRHLTDNGVSYLRKSMPNVEIL